MTNEQRMKNLSVPAGCVDVVLDTDAYNEIDDQFAIAYLLSCKEKLDTKAIYAAPFFNINSEGPADGMERSYHEIFKILDLLGESAEVFRGSNAFMSDERTPIISDAAADLVQRAKQYSPENPLYVVAIGAITNVASAILLDPIVAQNTVVVWLGGHGRDFIDTREFNMEGDILAARVVMGSGVPLVQLPCMGVVSEFRISKPELEYWFRGKNAVSDYLADNTIRAAERRHKGTPWTRCIWDVTAVAWLMNDNDALMESRIIPTHVPSLDFVYEQPEDAPPMRYIYQIKRDALMTDLVNRITSRK